MKLSEVSKRVRRFGIFLAILILLILALAWSLGAFKRVDLSLAEQPEALIAGQWFHASYREILDYAEMRFTQFVNDDPDITGICGLFYDHPKLVVSDSLVAFVGVILTDSAALPEGFTLRRLPAGPALHATFDGSPIIGQFKIYPAAGRWLEKNGKTVSGPVFEIYHRRESSKWVDYYFPVERYED